MKIRQEIQDFAEAMERVMQKHDEVKGDSYKWMSHLELQSLLQLEVLDTIDDDAKLENWVNVANFCMMIHWNTTHKEGSASNRG